MITILKHEQTKAYLKFRQIFEEDPLKARIYSIGKDCHELITRLNEFSPNVFQIFEKQKRYGVSVSMKLFAHEKLIAAYIVKSGRFYKKSGSVLFPLSLRILPVQYHGIFIKKYSWVRFLKECKFDNIAFNTIVAKKLYSRDKVLRHLYGCKAESALIIHEKFTREMKDWRLISKHFTNLDNLNGDLFNDLGLLTDTLSMAYKINEKVNAAWSVRRLKEQHDTWSAFITNALLETENEPLSIHPAFIKLNDFLGGIITDTKGLALEGGKQHHCVATYGHSVNSGRCAIFSINDHTAEVVLHNGKLKLNQFKGRRNVNAPDSLKNEVFNKIEDFNVQFQDIIRLPMPKVKIDDCDTLELPF